MSLVLCFLSLFVCVVQGQLDCDGAYSCAGMNVTISSGAIGCNGDHSCFKSPVILMDSSSSGAVRLRGAYSGYGAGLIKFPSSDGAIACFGYGSCAMVDKISEGSGSGGSVQCYGEYSCYGSTMDNGIGGNFYVQCWGTRGCSNTVIYNAAILNGQSDRAFENSILINDDSSRVSNAYFYFYSAFSGNNATINCTNGTSCYIYCYVNGCNNLNIVQCDDTSNNCSSNIIINCYDDAIVSDLCPNGLNNVTNIIDDLLNDDDYDEILDLTIRADIRDASRTCNTNITNATICANSSECNSIPITTNGVPLCCLSYNGCNGAGSNITVSINPSVNGSVIEQTALRCDAIGTCRRDDVINAINGGHMFFTAWEAGKATGILKTTDEYSIICSSEDACRWQTIVNSKNVYCAAVDSCYQTEMKDIKSSVYSLAYRATRNSILSSIGNNVYCIGYEACESTDLNDIGGNVYANGYDALYSAQITNVGGIIYGLGNRALRFSQITNASAVICSGEYSCSGSTISAVNYIYAIESSNNNNESSNILASTTIETDFASYNRTDIDNRTMLVEIQGTNDAGTLTITCNDGDRLQVVCVDSGSCNDNSTVIICDSGCQECLVDCDESIGIDCPASYENNDTYAYSIATDSPTDHPTASPVSEPTTMQTTMLTSMQTTMSTTNDDDEDEGNHTFIGLTFVNIGLVLFTYFIIVEF